MNKATRLILLFALASLSACGQANRGIAMVSGNSKTCIDGVEYIEFASGASVAYTPDGKIKTCK